MLRTLYFLLLLNFAQDYFIFVLIDYILMFIKGGSHQCVFVRMFVFNIWDKYGGKKLNVTDRIQHVFKEIRDSQSFEDSEKINYDKLFIRIKYICTRISELWRQSHYIKRTFDGTTGQSEYKQSFCDSEISDSNLFVTSYVPLQILKKAGLEEIVVWKNPRPSLTRYCRPIKFQYKKETTQVSVEEERYFTEKINALEPTEINLGNRRWSVRHKLQLTMVDGKVCNALSNTSSTKCYICQATPKEMNNLEICVQKVVNQDRYTFGLSPLHAWIRFFEFFLHISYRLDVKTWQVRGQASKDQVAKRKKHIQSQLR